MQGTVALGMFRSCKSPKAALIPKIQLYPVMIVVMLYALQIHNMPSYVIHCHAWKTSILQPLTVTLVINQITISCLVGTRLLFLHFGDFYIMSVVMHLSERLEIWAGCTVSIVIWKSKIIFSKKLCKKGLISIIMHN